MRRCLVIAVGLLLVASCSKSDSEQLSDAFASTASRAECVQVFETYRDEIVDARITGNVREVVRTFYTEAVLACPNAEVWDEVAKDVAPDTVTDWSDRYGRQSVLRGMCAEVEDVGFDVPACG